MREDGSGSLSILVLPIEGTIGIGGTVVFLALLVTDDRRTVVPNLPWTETVWASSDQSVATIVNGTATGLRLGSTKITAKYRGLTSSEVPLTVKDKQLSYILLEPPQAEVVVGGTRVFWVSARYADQTSEVVTDNCTWTLSDPEVARMEQGVVTGIKSGMTDIEVEYQGQKDSARLWVQGP